tara:strand:+ start:816 stop:1277 length:462 start_codon:yes stop_codon:yes gene_type:complete
MKKIILILLVSLGLQTQAQINYCDSMTVIGSQSQIVAQVNNVNTLMDCWTTHTTCGILMGSDSLTTSHLIYNFANPYDTIIICIYNTINGVTNSCSKTWVWNGMYWAKMMLNTNINEIEKSKSNNNIMYDLNGRKTLKPKGLYIKNNKLYFND